MISDQLAIQLFNAIFNFLGMAIMIPILFSIWSYKKRTKERFDQIERELDHILLLAHELYQSDVKEKKEAKLDQEIFVDSRETIPASPSGIKL